MNNKQFSFRRYKNKDADVLFREYQLYTYENVQPYYNAGTASDKEHVLSSIQEYCDKVYRPPVIVDENDDPFGFYRITYRHANRYHELTLYLWDNHHLTKAVLNNILIQALHIERPNDSVLLEVPGYNFCLKQAAEELGLKLTGTIPNYLCHGPELFDKYIYIITTKEWSVI